jgi:hypothetical protein
VVRNLEHAGAAVVLGSPGCVGKVPQWTKSDAYTRDELNINLCALRDGDIALARQLHTRFADVFWTLYRAGFDGQSRYGTAQDAYAISGKDGVHPGWAGHLVMAYTFLRALGLNGDLGTITADLANQTALGSPGHAVESFQNNLLTIVSTKYPFCADGPTNRDSSIRSGTTLVPFYPELSRFRLVVKNGGAAHYNVVWGGTTNTYTWEQLAAGVNLAADFPENPFSEPFRRVDAAVAAKQAFETHQIKELFHSPAAQTNLTAIFNASEAQRAPLAKAVADAVVPVRHTILIQPQ